MLESIGHDLVTEQQQMTMVNNSISIHLLSSYHQKREQTNRCMSSGRHWRLVVGEHPGRGQFLDLQF